jgi:hypothetical protein
VPSSTFFVQGALYGYNLTVMVRPSSFLDDPRRSDRDEAFGAGGALGWAYSEHKCRRDRQEAAAMPGLRIRKDSQPPSRSGPPDGMKPAAVSAARLSSALIDPRREGCRPRGRLAGHRYGSISADVSCGS